MPERESIIDIDLGNLHEEWRQQPKLRKEWGRKLADAKFDYAEAKAKVDLVEAQLKLRVRSNPNKYGLKKATEDSIKSKVIVHHLYQEAVMEANAAKHRVDKLEAMVQALEHRKHALQDEVTLFLQEYWAEPRLSRKRGRDKVYDREHR